MEEDKQPDLFRDFRKEAEVMRSIGGVFIGRFTDDPENPVQRLSRYYAHEDKKGAEADLRAGAWELPEAEM